MDTFSNFSYSCIGGVSTNNRNGVFRGYRRNSILALLREEIPSDDYSYPTISHPTIIILRYHSPQGFTQVCRLTRNTPVDCDKGNAPCRAVLLPRVSRVMEKYPRLMVTSVCPTSVVSKIPRKTCFASLLHSSHGKSSFGWWVHKHNRKNQPTNKIR